MDGNADLWRRILLGTIAAVVCAALAGGIYFWYVFPSSTNSVDTNLNGVVPTPMPVASTSTLGASQQALQKSVQGTASTTASPAVLQASQAALEKAVQNNKAAASRNVSTILRQSSFAFRLGPFADWSAD